MGDHRARGVVRGPSVRPDAAAAFEEEEAMRNLLIGLVVGLGIGLWFGVNLGRDRPLYANPFREPTLAETAKARAEDLMEKGREALRGE